MSTNNVILTAIKVSVLMLDAMLRTSTDLLINILDTTTFLPSALASVAYMFQFSKSALLPPNVKQE